MTPEVEQVTEALHRLRRSVLTKVAGVSDADAPVTHESRVRNLRWALLAVLDQTARHAGHADIIREQLDGVTGR